MRAVRRLCLVMVALAAVACTSAPPAAPRRLVVLAVDGLDPAITARLIRNGRLPHLAELASSSGIVPMEPVPGAETFSAWTSLITGTGPGTHGVFGLIAPARDTARPSLAPLSLRPSGRWLGRWWSEGAAYAAVSAVEPVWSHLGGAGFPATVLFVPGTFPPVAAPRVTTVAGVPAPDWSGSPGSAYTWLDTAIPESDTGPTRYGGQVQRLTFTRNIAHTTLVGLRTPERVDLPLTVTWNPEARSVNVQVRTESVYLAEGQQSRWITVTAHLNLLTRVQGLIRLWLQRAGNDVTLLISPIQWHPDTPPSPLSAPSPAAASLFARLGPYRTSSWPDMGWALADGYIGEDAFLAVQDDTFSDRAEALLNRIDAGDWSLLVAGIETIDTTTRLLWRAIDRGHPAYDPVVAARFRGAIDEAYEKLDALVGEVRGRLPDETGLLVVSPYGQSAARTVVDLNRLLADEGLLTWREPPMPVTLAALADATPGDDGVDWSETRARAMGPGHIYFNRRDRWPHGIVETGADEEQLRERLRARLEGLVDPISGRRVVSRVRTGAEAFPGARSGDAPDLVVSFVPGVRLSWDSMLGGMAGTVVGRNTERFSAEHASVDERHVPGVWLASWNAARDEDSPFSVLDVAPTILGYFGQPVPEGLGGSARLPDQPRDMPSSSSRR